jgi:hypothetical protein
MSLSLNPIIPPLSSSSLPLPSSVNRHCFPIHSPTSTTITIATVKQDIVNKEEQLTKEIIVCITNYLKYIFVIYYLFLFYYYKYNFHIYMYVCICMCYIYIYIYVYIYICIHICI